MAIAAWNCDVPTRELELGLLVLCQCEGGRTVALQVVTLVALVFIGLGRELIVVLVHVAIGAALKVRDLEYRVLTLWGVALIALHLGVTFD